MTIKEIYELFLLHPNVVTDSRKIEKDCLFFALKGEKFNGNLFAEEALSKGAAYAIVDEKEFCQEKKTILVDDVLTTLQHLAKHHRKKLGIPILGITGTNGKTTTKELVAAVLAAKYRVVFTQGNLNNQIGVPLTLLQMDTTTEIGVVEMGANHPGEIAELCAIADPDFGLITNVGRAHLEGFGSFEAIKNTKAGLYRHLKRKGGTVFYNIDNSVLSELAADIKNKISYGEKNADFTGQPVWSPPYIHVKAVFPQGILYLNSQLTGQYNFENILAAVCIGNFLKVDPQDIQSALQKYTPQNNRSQLIEKGELKIVLDAYNANPVSMKASIESFVSMFPSPRFLILGDMLELGSFSGEEHSAIVHQIKKHPFEEVFFVGPLFTEAAKGFSFKTFRDSVELCGYLAQNPVSRGAVLIKGSRGIQLEKVLEVL
jgi:UDP-N-acetylmuramoyl-tripeptide--D-alanyl-D-alanine ligase